jgi:uncharacterized protein
MSKGSVQICIEIVYAQPQHSIVKFLRIEQGSLVGDALRWAALQADFSAVDLANAPVGIFGTPARRDQVLKDHDRIEIYRALAEEPKLARRMRVRAARQ